MSTFFLQNQNSGLSTAFETLHRVGYLPTNAREHFIQLPEKLDPLCQKEKPFDVLERLKLTNPDLHQAIATKPRLAEEEVAEFDAFVDALNVSEVISEMTGGKQSFSIFGYGSIIDPNSKATLRSFEQSEAAQAVEALGFGFKRGFFYDASTLPFEKNPYFSNEAEFAFCRQKHMVSAIGMKKTERLSDVTTGTLYPSISEETFKKLLKREWGYRMVPVRIVTIKRDEEGQVTLEPMVSWTFEPKQHLLSKANDLPMRYYVDTCLEGAQKQGFSQHSKAAWIATTEYGDDQPMNDLLNSWYFFFYYHAPIFTAIRVFSSMSNVCLEILNSIAQTLSSTFSAKVETSPLENDKRLAII